MKNLFDKLDEINENIVDYKEISEEIIEILERIDSKLSTINGENNMWIKSIRER